uniref:Uncharacterized protein n=1 Tax=Rhizophora mucronata TaxID=61149 RepID=A0A2P2QHW6_RHIMU
MTRRVTWAGGEKRKSIQVLLFFEVFRNIY